MAKRKKDEEQLTDLEQLFHARKLSDRGIAPDDPAFKEMYPRLFYYLTEVHVGDKVTDPAYIKIANSAGDWVFSLGQPGAGAACEVMVSTFQDGLRTLEERLAGGPAVFRFWKKGKPVLRPNGEKDEEP